MKTHLVVGTLLTASGLAVGVGCSGYTRTIESPASPPTAGAGFDRDQLGNAANLLESLDGRVNNLEVVREGGVCARLLLRGRGSISADQPTVYLNGSPTLDSCVLEQIGLHEVDRVEVLAGPARARAAFPGSGGGAILVYLRSR